LLAINGNIDSKKYVQNLDSNLWLIVAENFTKSLFYIQGWHATTQSYFSSEWRTK